MSLHYTIQPENPAAHLFRVSLTLNGDAATAHDGTATLTLRLPDWIPGSYMIRDFARNIVEISATVAGEPVVVSKLDKSGWQLQTDTDSAPVTGQPGDIVVTYLVYAWELSVRASHLEQLHGFFNGTSVFLAVPGREQEPCSVEIIRPRGAQFSDLSLIHI